MFTGRNHGVSSRQLLQEAVLLVLVVQHRQFRAKPSSSQPFGGVAKALMPHAAVADGNSDPLSQPVTLQVVVVCVCVGGGTMEGSSEQ